MPCCCWLLLLLLSSTAGASCGSGRAVRPQTTHECTIKAPFASHVAVQAFTFSFCCLLLLLAPFLPELFLAVAIMRNIVH
jgi:hypothetical protein